MIFFFLHIKCDDPNLKILVISKKKTLKGDQKIGIN